MPSVGLQKVASEDSPPRSSDVGVPLVVSHPHLFPSSQVRADLRGALVVPVASPLCVENGQSRAVLVHGNIELAVVVGAHEAEGENVDASHWRCEEPGVSVVAAADVGDDGVEEEDVVSAHVDGGLAEAHSEGHCQGMESGSQSQFGVVAENIDLWCCC